MNGEVGTGAVAAAEAPLISKPPSPEPGHQVRKTWGLRDTQPWSYLQFLENLAESPLGDPCQALRCQYCPAGAAMPPYSSRCH